MITKQQATLLRYRQELYHTTERNADGTALRCRVNGPIKTWKTRPQEWRLPVKYGLRKCFYIDHSNAEEWLLDDPTN